MPLKHREIVRGLGKIGFESTRKSKHEVFKLYVNGELFAQTLVSHGRSEVGDALLSRMARQIRVQKSLFEDICGCTKGRDDYFGGQIPSD